MLISLWIFALVLMVVIMILQDWTRFSSDRVRDLLNDMGFYVFLAVIVAIGIFNFVRYRRSGYFPVKGFTWVVAALLCWWLFFRDDSRNRPND